MSTNQPAAPAVPAKAPKVKKPKVQGGTKRASSFIVKAGQGKSRASGGTAKGLKQNKGNPFIVKR
jgi:hypothetical protein